MVDFEELVADTATCCAFLLPRPALGREAADRGMNKLLDPAGGAAGLLTTNWDVIVVGEFRYSTFANKISFDLTVLQGAGPAGIIVADRMSESGLKTYVY